MLGERSASRKWRQTPLKGARPSVKGSREPGIDLWQRPAGLPGSALPAEAPGPSSSRCNRFMHERSNLPSCAAARLGLGVPEIVAPPAGMPAREERANACLDAENRRPLARRPRLRRRPAGPGTRFPWLPVPDLARRFRNSARDASLPPRLLACRFPGATPPGAANACTSTSRTGAWVRGAPSSATGYPGRGSGPNGAARREGAPATARRTRACYCNRPRVRHGSAH